MLLLSLSLIVIQSSQLAVEAKQPPPATSRFPVVINHSTFSFGTTNAVLKTPIEPNVSKQKAAISTTSYTTEAATYKLPIKYPGSVSPRLRRKRNPEVWDCTLYHTHTVYYDDVNARERRNANTVSHNARQKRNANASCDTTRYQTRTMSRGLRPCAPCSIRVRNGNNDAGHCSWSRHAPCW